MYESDTSKNRMKTGINGLDNMLNGGVPLNNQVVIAGGPGAGKTLLCFEVAYKNAKLGTPSIFISFEEDSKYLLDNIKEAFSDFNDIDKLIADKMLVIGGRDPGIMIENSNTADKYTFGRVMSEIEKLITDNKSKFVVIDSISLLGLLLENDLDYRRSMVTMSSNLKKLGVTAFLIMEMTIADRDHMRYTPEFFIFDGIITLYMQGENDKRALNLEIFTMRGTNHSRAVSPYEITSSGMRVFTIES